MPPSPPFPGRLRFYTRGNSISFRFLRYHQPRHHLVRQVHRSQRVRLRPLPSNPPSSLANPPTAPHSYAYVEFAEPSLVANAVLLNETMFRGRLLKVRFYSPFPLSPYSLRIATRQVTPKRTNVPGMGARGRGRGRGCGGYRGGYQGVSSRPSLPILQRRVELTRVTWLVQHGGFSPYARGGGRGRGRGRGGPPMY